MSASIDFDDALDWYLSSSTPPQPVLVVEKEAILQEIQAISSEKSIYKEWASFAFDSVYADRSALTKAQQSAKPDGRNALDSTNSCTAQSNLNAQYIQRQLDFSCPELEKYVNKDMFNESVPTLKIVETAVGVLKTSYTHWLNDRKKSLRYEVGVKLTDPIEWNSISFRNQQLLKDHRLNKQLLRTIALSKKGYVLSRHDIQNIRDLFSSAPDESSVGNQKDEMMTFDKLNSGKLEINEKLNKMNDQYYNTACEHAETIWKPIFGIIDFIEENIKKLDDIIGEETINDTLENLCSSHGMDVFLPFEMYWHPIEQILKRKYKSGNADKLEAEVNAALAKYFRFYRDVTDASNGIPGVLKKCVSGLMDFIRQFMIEYSEVLKTINVPNRPDVTDKIVKESMLSFEGLTKVTEGRVKEMTLDMSERKADILDEIVEFIDFLASSNGKAPENRLDRLSRRETRKRFTSLDRKFLNLVKSTKAHLTHSFPSLHLALIGYMMVKFFVYEKTYEESKMMSDLLQQKVQEMSDLIMIRDKCMQQYENGVELGMFQLSICFVKQFKAKLIERYEEHLTVIEKKLHEKEFERIEVNEILLTQDELPSPSSSSSSISSSKKNKKKKSKASSKIDSHKCIASAEVDTGTYCQTEPLESDAIITELQKQLDNMLQRIVTANEEADQFKTRAILAEKELQFCKKECEELRGDCNSFKNRIAELEKELINVRKSFTPPPVPHGMASVIPPARQLSPRTPPHLLFATPGNGSSSAFSSVINNGTSQMVKPIPIGSHLKSTSTCELPSPPLFSPWFSNSSPTSPHPHSNINRNQHFG